ncbi:HTH domain-containing protein [Halorubellus sp. PRR65]|uniref:HTH domain-containing protein n=1 Tax=Halorubellus sp. PRR65 TaxID=3098148 RepID=UPI002B262B54|nr:HTH domain-containing protein [Halorubellus sp. PRR65]
MTATLRVYHRAYTPISKPLNEIVAAARTLDTTGKVDACTFTEWPTTVALDSDCEPVRLYETLTDWAESEPVDPTTPFRIHTRTNPVTDTEQAILHTPVVYLTLERDGDLAGVAPCTLPDGTHVTARDFLDAIQDGDDPLDDRSIDAIPA